MNVQDDFLLLKPARRETVTVLRIALMALIGCLVLLSILVIQARAEPEAALHRQIKVNHHVEQQPKPAGPFRQMRAVPRHPHPVR